tara:strand:- start:325 stop:741 length:417 start_codon:yes stop_codon:yes gene_type:complete
MALFLTERISEFETMYNDKAAFVYFDTQKLDSTHTEALLVKSLREDSKLEIIYRKNMSDNGVWTPDEFNYEGSMVVAKCFHNIRSFLREGRLVIFPSISFSIVKETSPAYVQKDLEKGYIEMLNTNPENKNKFDYYAI